MRRLDDTPIDPEIAACLDAIDATLAGDPVDPRHAELAELALLLADERPRHRPQFASELDARAARRFVPAPSAAAVAGAGAGRRKSRLWRGLAAGGVSGACIAAIVLVVVILSARTGAPTRPPSSAPSSTVATSTSRSGSSASAAASGSAKAPGAHARSAPP